jgi:hypothetical protein
MVGRGHDQDRAAIGQMGDRAAVRGTGAKVRREAAAQT